MSVFSDIGNFIGNILGIGSDAQNVAATNEANFAIADMQRQQQDFYAQHGIQIKANDARRAGVNVNTALGAQTSMPSWQSPNLATAQPGGMMADAGKSLGQVLSQLTTKEETMSELEKLGVERARLENDLLRSQISLTKSPGRTTSLPSAMDNSPVPGQGNSNMNVKPAEVTASAKFNPAHEPGAINELHFAKDAGGRVRPVMSSDFKQRAEDDLWTTWDWNIRNRILSFWDGPSKPTFPAGRGRHWEWDLGSQAYISVPNKETHSLASPGPTPYNKSYRRK